MKRLYYLATNLSTTEQISSDLHEAGVTDQNLHVLSKDDAELTRNNIHPATFYQKSDMIRGGERGAFLGIAGGLLVAVCLLLFSPSEMVAGTTVIILSILGALLGAILGGAHGLMQGSYKIAKYGEALRQGKHLIMVDLEQHEEQRIRSLMSRKHPEGILVKSGLVQILPFN